MRSRSGLAVQAAHARVLRRPLSTLKTRLVTVSFEMDQQLVFKVMAALASLLVALTLARRGSLFLQSNPSLNLLVRTPDHKAEVCLYIPRSSYTTISWRFAGTFSGLVTARSGRLRSSAGHGSGTL